MTWAGNDALNQAFYDTTYRACMLSEMGRSIKNQLWSPELKTVIMGAIILSRWLPSLFAGPLIRI
jgi:hypothetical protein